MNVYKDNLCFPELNDGKIRLHVDLSKEDVELLKTANSHYNNPIGWFAMTRELLNGLIDEAEK